jgi:phosphate uptake regulator
MMSSFTDRILQAAFEAFLTRNSELCDQVIAEDEEIDTLEKQVDEDGVGLLIRFHLVASDLRQVASAMMRSITKEAPFRRRISFALVMVAITGLIGAGLNAFMFDLLPKFLVKV